MNIESATYKLPKGWVWTTIDELGIVVSGGTPSTRNPEFWGGNIPWITPADLSGYHYKFITHGKRFLSQLGLDYSSAGIVPEGSILFSSRAPIGYVAIAKTKLATNQGFKNLIPMESTPIDYLYYYLLSSKSLAEGLASGTTFLELSATNFRKIPVPLPPQDEQQQIVQKIEELLSELTQSEKSLQKAKNKLENYKQSILKQAFEGALTKEWRSKDIPLSASKELEIIQKNKLEKYNEGIESWNKALKHKNKGSKPRKIPQILKIEKGEHILLSEIPSSWEWDKIGNFSFVTKLAGFEFSKYVTYQTNGEIPVIKAQNVSKKGFHGTINSYVDNETLEMLPRIQMRGGEILFVFIGAGIGNVAIVPEGRQYLLGPNVAMIRIEPGIFNKFLVYFLMSLVGRKHIDKLTRATAQGSISMENIRKVIVPVAPYQEQIEIVKEIEYRFTIIEHLEKNIVSNNMRAEALKLSILKHAFRGKLVINDTVAENAHSLLEKIKAEKEKYSITQKEIKKNASKKIIMSHKLQTILDILKASKKPMPAKDVWLQSEHQDNIEAFYEDLKSLQDKVVEIEKGFLSLKNENR